MTLRIAAYVWPRGMRNPTGVTKHQINMVKALAVRPDVQLVLLAPRQDLIDGPQVARRGSE